MMIVALASLQLSYGLELDILYMDSSQFGDDVIKK
jgi:hypothetical protein